MENNLIGIDIERMMLTSGGPVKLSVDTTIHTGELVALFESWCRQKV